MELKDLSSNWKKLQQTLNKEQKPKKRKAGEEFSRPTRNGPKRQRTTPKDINSANKANVHPANKPVMGLSTSRPAAQSLVPSATLALWGADNNIPPADLAAAYGPDLKTSIIPPLRHTTDSANAGRSPNVEVGKYIAIDCEMVGVGPNPDNESALARVSLVNYHGEQLYDSFVLPMEPVTDYRTHVSGITPQLLRNARPLREVQEDVAALTQGKVLVGHAIRNDLDALMLGHPKRDIRDTSRYAGFRALAGGRPPALKKLARELLGVEIQGGEHSSVEDARATMLLYRREKEGFEREHVQRWGSGRKEEGKQGGEDEKMVKRGRKKKSKR